MRNINKTRQLNSLKETRDKINKMILDDAKDLIKECFEQPDIEEITQDIEYIMPLAEGFEELSQKDSRQKNKNKTILRALFLELFLTLCFGFLAIPAVFRKEKFYAIVVLIVNGLAALLFFQFGFWYLFIISGLLYLVEVWNSISRIIIFLRGKNYFKKFHHEFDREENFSFTEL